VAHLGTHMYCTLMFAGRSDLIGMLSRDSHFLGSAARHVIGAVQQLNTPAPRPINYYSS
jgi:hypothetical protein